MEKDPFQASIGGVFPYILVDGEIQYHAPGNIITTTLCPNFLKYAFISSTKTEV